MALMLIPSSLTSISSVQLLSHVQLFVTLWTAARQASLSITNSQSLLQLISIVSVMPFLAYSLVIILTIEKVWTIFYFLLCNYDKHLGGVVLEKTLESPLDIKETQPVHPKGNQSWIFIGRTDAEAETPILWAPHVKNRLTWKDPDAGKDWRWEERGMIEDEMVGWHHQLHGHEFE